MQSYVTNGNFTADHIRQTRPDNDHWLTSGEGMMTERMSYEAHIKSAKDIPDVSFVGFDAYWPMSNNLVR